MFQKKNVLYEDHTANNSATKQFLYATIVTSLIYLLFVTFSLVFPKTSLFINYGKPFGK